MSVSLISYEKLGELIIIILHCCFKIQITTEIDITIWKIPSTFLAHSRCALMLVIIIIIITSSLPLPAVPTLVSYYIVIFGFPSRS